MSELKQTLVQYMGEDEIIADAARVSTDRDREGKQIAGLLRYLGKEKHLSPFEHTAITFMIEAPLFVRDQWVRHRTQSYNSLSLRYATIKPDSLEKLFYIPPEERPLVNKGSGAHPVFEEAPDKQLYKDTVDALEAAYHDAYYTYIGLIEEGVAEEVARFVLPEATMTRFYATANLRNWAAFVKERTADNAQWEIKQIAKEIDQQLSKLYPLAWKALTSKQQYVDIVARTIGELKPDEEFDDETEFDREYRNACYGLAEEIIEALGPAL